MYTSVVGFSCQHGIGFHGLESFTLSSRMQLTASQLSHKENWTFPRMPLPKQKLFWFFFPPWGLKCGFVLLFSNTFLLYMVLCFPLHLWVLFRSNIVSSICFIGLRAPQPLMLHECATKSSMLPGCVQKKTRLEGTPAFLIEKYSFTWWLLEWTLPIMFYIDFE